MLTENEKLYEALESALRNFYNIDDYVFVHAIYEPDDEDKAHEGMHHAAVDLHEPGITYHVWFIVGEADILLNSSERWLMG